jgi:hypothetical protein
MANHASPRFWSAYEALPNNAKRLADKSFALFEQNPRHPSLHFKLVGRFWSVRVGSSYRALAVPIDDGLLWSWIGTHEEYERLLRSRE